MLRRRSSSFERFYAAKEDGILGPTRTDLRQTEHNRTQRLFGICEGGADRSQSVGSSFGHEQDTIVDSGWEVQPQTKDNYLTWDERIFHRLKDVKMVRSAGKAVTGDGVCIGLTYRDRAFIHPKTAHDKALLE